MGDEGSTQKDALLEKTLHHVDVLEKRIAQLEALMGGSSSPDAGERFATEESIVPSPKIVSEDAAYTLRAVRDPRKVERGVTRELEIKDANLIKLMKNEIGTYPGIDFDGKVVLMESPFPAIIHSWDKLHDRVSRTPDPQSCKDLASLLANISTTPELEDYFKTRASNASSNAVTFETLWVLFAPNSLIVARPFMDVDQILQVVDSPNVSRRSFRIKAWQWDWDGKRVMKVKYELEIDRFRGTKQIAELPFHPLKYTLQPDALCATIRERSLKFIKATVRCDSGSSQLFQYKGYVYTHLRNIFPGSDREDDKDDDTISKAQEDDFAPKLRFIKGEIICDAQAFLQYGGAGFPPLGGIWDRHRIQLDEQATFEDSYRFEDTLNMLDTNNELDRTNHNFLLLPPRLLGYATKEKAWVQFNAELTTPALGKQPGKFRDVLQLDEVYKDLIHSLIISHDSNQANAVTDVIQDKGKGLAILLHGPPGVGKTLTAETIAEATGRPLFVISVAEIGLNPARAEQSFEKVHKLACRWNAIILIDEADVFLETRSSSNGTSQNALVSVLLRVLEYSQGIIILTTNRIKSFDVAVVSRINLPIRYLDLDSKQKVRLFRYFLDQLDENWIGDRGMMDEYIAEYGLGFEFNGRQIRNVVSGALALARNDAKDGGNGKLKVKHLKMMIRVTGDFDNVLQENMMSQRFNNEAK